MKSLNEITFFISSFIATIYKQVRINNRHRGFIRNTVADIPELDVMLRIAHITNNLRP